MADDSTMSALDLALIATATQLTSAMIAKFPSATRPHEAVALYRQVLALLHEDAVPTGA